MLRVPRGSASRALEVRQEANMDDPVNAPRAPVDVVCHLKPVQATGKAAAIEAAGAINWSKAVG
jgi:hypothetical protein